MGWYGVRGSRDGKRMREMLMINRNFEPPFDVPTYFATEVILNLTCVGGGNRCTLPAGSSPLFARVDAVND